MIFSMVCMREQFNSRKVFCIVILVFISLINRNIHLPLNNDNLKEIYPKGTILVANKREKNLQQLLMENDPYNIKDAQQLKEDRGYT